MNINLELSIKILLLIDSGAEESLNSRPICQTTIYCLVNF